MSAGHVAFRSHLALERAAQVETVRVVRGLRPRVADEALCVEALGEGHANARPDAEATAGDSQQFHGVEGLRTVFHGLLH